MSPKACLILFEQSRGSDVQVMMNALVFTVETKGYINDPTTLMPRQQMIHSAHKWPH